MLSFQFTCVGATGRNLENLFHIIENNREITRKTFLKYVDREEMKDIENQLGYGSWLRMSQDWHVSYHKSKTLEGLPVYYFRHSAIEYVFHA